MLVDDENPVVCRVTPQGDVICEPVAVLTAVVADPKARQSLSDSIEAAFPGCAWGPNKFLLAMNILDVLCKSKLPDTPNIPRRSGEIVNTVGMLMEAEPPSVLLYTYSTLPADVVGAFFLNKADLVKMQRLYDTFKSPRLP